MSVFERERQHTEKILKLYEEGALDISISIKTAWINENMQKAVDILTKGKVEHFRISKAILHPTKDVGPKTHERYISIRLITSPFKIDEVLKTLQEVGKAEIDNVQSGMLLLTESHGMTFLLKEEEP